MSLSQPFNLGPFNLGPFNLGPFNLGPFNLGPFNLGPITAKIILPAGYWLCAYNRIKHR